MFTSRSWLSLAAVTLIATGCAQSPMPTAPQAQAPAADPAAATYSVQAVTTPVIGTTRRGELGTTDRDERVGTLDRDDRLGRMDRDDRLGRMDRDERMGRMDRDDRFGRFERFGRRPVWWGAYGVPRTRILVNDSYLMYGGYYYPYYVVGENVYPIYSMPYILYGSTYVPFYTRRTIVGPSVFGLRRARIFRHRGGHRF